MTNRIFVVRRYGAISDSWNEHTDKTFDEVVAVMVDRIKDDKVGSRGFEVVEMAEVRRVKVEAQITTVDVTEVPA